LNTIRETFVLDIRSLPGNLPRLRSLAGENCRSEKGKRSPCHDRVETLHSKLNTTGGHVLIASALFVDGLSRGENPAEALESVVQDTSIDNGDFNFDSTLKIANMVSQSLRSASADSIWIGEKEIRKLLADSNTLKIYFGLIHARSKQLHLDIGIERLMAATNGCVASAPRIATSGPKTTARPYSRSPWFWKKRCCRKALPRMQGRFSESFLFRYRCGSHYRLPV
jgi:hypothetical protein